MMAHLVEQQNIPVPHESHNELHTTALSIRYLMHMPVQVDVEDVKEPIPPLLVPVPAYRVEEV